MDRMTHMLKALRLLDDVLSVSLSRTTALLPGMCQDSKLTQFHSCCDHTGVSLLNNSDNLKTHHCQQQQQLRRNVIAVATRSSAQK